MTSETAHQVLALKWRPKAFDEVVGQATVTQTLKNAIRAGRLGHAFLFSGPRGVGKTTTARILAKALNCAESEAPTTEPCHNCAPCREVAAGNCLDVQEIDGASNNGVEHVRELRESARYNPARDRFKVWIIDEVHMLTGPAFNALLKTLEEPPPRVKFIFATTEPHKLPDTILSRCQQHDFRLIPARVLQSHLRMVSEAEKIRVSDESLARIARAAEGSARDALSLFDQVLSFSGSEVRDEDVAPLLGVVDRELLLAASRGVLEQDSLALLDLVEKLSEYGADSRNFVRELILHFREILLVKLAPDSSVLLDPIVPEERERLAPLAEGFSEDDLLRTLEVLTRTEGELRTVTDPRVSLELALLKLAQMRRLMPFARLVERVEHLVAGLPPPTQEAPATRATTRAAASTPVPAGASADRAPRDEASRILAAMLADARPSLAGPLRGAQATLAGDTLTLDVAADLRAMAEAHAEDYHAMAIKAVGRRVKVKFAGAPGVEHDAEGAPSAPEKRQTELPTPSPQVQEILDMFNGKIVGVRSDGTR
jgi:DNA polymerase-3 subunit gamma/tau